MWLVAGLLPGAAAAKLGAMLLGAVGPQLRKQRQVLRNLHRVLPDASPAELRRVARGVWANLGSVLFEYPHLEQIVRERISVTMPESIRARMEAGEPMLYLTGHLANWEVLARYLSGRGAGLVVVYSPDDNPVMERLVQNFRAADGSVYVTKQEALRRLTPKFLQRRSVGLLPDVRVDSGPSLPLFGSAAPTTTSPPRLAARLDYPLVPVRAKRLGPARFEVEFLEPLTADPAHIGKRAAVDLMCQFNQVLETWISERPDEWLCTKRRWPKTPRGR
ncbi:MAG: lysophospholipid acyltransferase family protein [Pseudomonadales bacterium]